MSAGGAIRAGRAFVEAFLDDTRLVRGLRRTQARLRAFGGTVQRIGRAFIVPAAVGGALFGLTAVVFANFEKNLARAAALVNATEKEFEALRSTARKLGETTQFSASQAAGAMSIFAQAGFNVAQILESVGPTLDLAAAGQIEIAEAADIAAKALKGMGLQTSDLAMVVDTLAAAAVSANTDVTGIGEALSFVGPIAKSAGISLQDVVGTIIALQDAGQAGGQAGTTLRGVLLALVSPSVEAAKRLEGLGIDIDDGSGKMQVFSKIIRQFETQLDGLSETQRLNILGKIFPARGIAGVSALIGLGSDKLEELEQKVRKAGVASRLAAAGIDTLSGQFQILLSALESVGISIGKAILKPVRAAIETVAKFLSIISQWVEKNQELIRSIFLSVVAAAGFGVGLTALGAVLKIAAGLLGAVATVIGVVVTALGAIISPVGLAVVALAALIASMVDLRAVATNVVSFVVKAFDELKDRVGGSIQAVIDALKSGDLVSAGKILFSLLEAEFRRAVIVLNDIWQDWKFFFIEAVSNAKVLAVEAFLNIGNSFSDTVNEMIENSDNWFLNLLNGLNKFVGAFRNGMRIIRETIDDTFIALGEFGAEGSPAQIFAEQLKAEKKFGAPGEQTAQEQRQTLNDVRAKADAEIKAARAARDRAKQDARNALKEAEQTLEQTKIEAAQERQEQQKEDEVRAGPGPLSTREEANRQASAELERRLAAIDQEALATAKSRSEEAGKSALDLTRLERGQQLRERREAEKQERLRRAGMMKAADTAAEGFGVAADVFGSFSAFALRGAGATGAADRTAKATEETAKTLNTIKEKFRPGVFIG